jgi:hypothetical protein
MSSLIIQTELGSPKEGKRHKILEKFMAEIFEGKI